jgi:hypothetical protein
MFFFFTWHHKRWSLSQNLLLQICLYQWFQNCSGFVRNPYINGSDDELQIKTLLQNPHWEYDLHWSGQKLSPHHSRHSKVNYRNVKVSDDTVTHVLVSGLWHDAVCTCRWYRRFGGTYCIQLQGWTGPFRLLSKIEKEACKNVTGGYGRNFVWRWWHCGGPRYDNF